MSAPNEPESVATGTSLLENVMRMRKEKGMSSQVEDGEGEGESQIKTRQLNLNADEMDGPGVGSSNITSKRRVQQPEKPSDEEREEEERAHSALGKSLFGENRYEAARERALKKMGGEEGTQGDGGGEGQASEGGKDDSNSAADKNKGKATKVVKAPPQVSITREDLAELSASIASAVRQPQSDGEDKPKKEEEDPMASLGDDDRDMYEAAVEMSKSKPDRYKDLPQQMVECFERKAEYRKEWEKENPGQKFSWKDDAHSSFLETVAPEYLDKDFDKAIARIEARRELKSEREKDSERLNEIESRLVEATMKEQVAEKASSALREFAKDFIPEADYDLGTPDGLKLAIEGEDLLGETIGKYAGIIDASTTELAKVYGSGGKYRLRPGNSLHVWISQTLNSYEDALAAKAPVNEIGQRFAPRSEYFKMSESQRARHWTIGEEQAYWIVRDHATRMAKTEREKISDKLKSAAKSRGWTFSPETIVSRRKKAEGQKAQPQQKQQQPPQKRKETNPPESPSGGVTDTRSDKSGSQGETFVSGLMSKLFPRRQKQQ